MDYRVMQSRKSVDWNYVPGWHYVVCKEDGVPRIVSKHLTRVEALVAIEALEHAAKARPALGH